MRLLIEDLRAPIVHARPTRWRCILAIVQIRKLLKVKWTKIDSGWNLISDSECRSSISELGELLGESNVFLMTANSADWKFFKLIAIGELQIGIPSEGSVFDLKTAGEKFQTPLGMEVRVKKCHRRADGMQFKKVRKQIRCLMKEKETRKSKLIKCIKEIKMITLYCASRILCAAFFFSRSPLHFALFCSSHIPSLRLESHKEIEKELIKAPFGFADWNGKWWEWWILIAHWSAAWQCRLLETKALNY